MAILGSNSLSIWALVALGLLSVTFQPTNSFSIGSLNSKNHEMVNFEVNNEDKINDNLSLCSTSCSKSSSIRNRMKTYFDSKRTETTFNKIQFENDKTYTYQIELRTRLNKNQNEKNQYDIEYNENDENQMKIKALADISFYQSCDAALRIRNTEIYGLNSEDTDSVSNMKRQLESESTHFSIDNGRIEHVCADKNENEWTLNIKKSILSAIQVTSENLNEKETVIETDINGQCETIYQPINQWKYGSSYDNKKTAINIMKTKDLSKCNQRHQINLGLFPRSYGLDQLVRSSMPLINSTYECKQRIEDGIVVNSRCCDKQTIWPVKITIDSDIDVKLIEEKDALSVQKPQNMNQFSRQNLAWSSTYKTNHVSDRYGPQYTVQDAEQIVNKICQQVQDSIEIDVPQMFSQLVQIKRNLTVQDEQQIWQQIQSGSVCQSPKMVDIYLDASALAGTEGSVEVLIQAYQQYYQVVGQEQFLPRFSYLFSLLAFAKTPTVEAGQRLVQFVQQQQDFQQYQLPEYRQIVYGVTGFIHNIRQSQQQQWQRQTDNVPSVTERDVDQLVVQMQQYQIGQLEQCVQQMSPASQKVNVTTCLTWVNGLENVGVYVPTQVDVQQQLVQRLIQVVQNLQSTPEYAPIRTAIIRSLIVAIPNDTTTRQYLLHQVFKQENEQLAVRIEAYKTLVLSSPKITELEEIHQYIQQIAGQKQHGSDDLVQYVRSHQANLHTTSDLYRRSILPLGAPLFEKPLVGAFDVSRNYELSYLNDVYQMGVTTEVDVIYGGEESGSQTGRRSPYTIPQVFQFNLTIPVMGREFQAVQVRVEQTGLDRVVSQKFDEFKRAHEQARLMDPIIIIKKLVEVAREQGQQMLKQNPEFHLYIQVAMDGKTVVVLDQQDLVQWVTMGTWFDQFIQNVFAGQKQQVSIDRAFASIPIDFIAGLTTTNGLPIQVQVNSSIVLGLKSDIQVQMASSEHSDSILQLAVWPSIAGQVDARVQYSTGSHIKSISHKARVYSAPHLSLVAQLNSEGGIFKWFMPEDQFTILRFETGFYSTEPTRQIQVLRESTRPVHFRKQCTDFTKKTLGVALCNDVNYDNQVDRSVFVYELTLEKFDKQIQTFEIYMSNPIKYIRWLFSNARSTEQQKRSLKFSFNTPGSRIDRELAFELELPTFNFESGLLKEARLRLQTPWKQISAQAITHNQQNDRVLNLELAVDHRKLIAMELSLTAVQQRGPLIEYQAKLILSTPFNRRPINLMGVWSSQQGQKAQWHLALEDVEQKRHFVQATIVKTGDLIDGDFKSSVHCMVDLAGVSAKTSGILVRSARSLKLDLNTDYDLFASGRRDSLQLGISHQNMASESSQMIKLLQKVKWSCTQFPKYDMDCLHHLTFDPLANYYEHDIKLGWNQDSEQIRCYNMAKMQTAARQQSTDKYDVDSETILVVRPLKINYQVKAQSSLVGVESLNGIKSYRLTAEGHRRDQPEADKIAAQLTYEQTSDSPLKMKMLASVKSDFVDFIYSDDIQEEQPNKYNGHMLIQLTPQRKYAANYVYSVKNEKDEQQHRIDVTLNDAITNQLKCKHQGQINFVPSRALNVQSKWTGEHDQDVFDGKLSWNRFGSSQCQFVHYPTETEGDVLVDLNGQPMQGKVQLKSGDWKHQTEVQYKKAEKFLKLNSKTMNQEKEILSVDSEIAPRHDSHLKIDADCGFNAHCQYDDSNQEKSMARLAFRLPSEWSHNTKMTSYPTKGRYEIDSETNYKNENMANIDGSYDREMKKYHLKFSAPKTEGKIVADNKQYDVEFKNQQYDHRTHFECDPSSDYETALQCISSPRKIEFESKTLKNGKNIATVKYDCDDHEHKATLDCDDVVRGRGQFNYKTHEPYANVEFDWLKGETPFQHQTTVNGNLNDKTWNLNSKTSMSDERIAKIKASIAQKNCDASIDLPQFEAGVSYENDDAKDQKQVQFDYNGKTFCEDCEHKTLIKIQKRSIVDLKSETTSKKDKSNYVKIDGQYRHKDEDKSSNLDVQLGQFLRAMTHFNLFNENEKQVHLNGEYKDQETGKQYHHQTEAKYWPKDFAMKIDSKVTDISNGKKIGSLRSYLTKNYDKTSYFQTESEDTSKFPRTKIEINPRMKRAAVDFEMNPIQHSTEYQTDKSGTQFRTTTLKNQQNVFNFDTEYNRDPTSRSHLKVHVGPKYQANVHVYPQKRSGSFSFQTPTIRHGTEMALNPNMGYGQPTTIQSTTHYRDDILADINARLEGLEGENVIKANVPSWVRLDSTIDAPGHRLSFDAQSDRLARHAMGSIYASPKRRDVTTGVEGRDMHFDFAWDVDRDPRSRVLVDVSVKRQQDQTVVVTGDFDYAHNKLTVQYELTPGNFIANWARVSVGYIPYTNVDSWQIVYTHSNHLPQIECKLELLTNGQIRYAVRMTSQITGERFVFDFQTTSPQNIESQINVNVMGVDQGQGQYYLKVNVQRAVEERYEMEATAQQDSDYPIYVGKIELRFPRIETQTFEYRIDLPGRHVEVQLVAPQNGKQFKLIGDIQDQLVQFLINSDLVYMPKIFGKVKLVPSEEYYASFDYDNERIFIIQYKQNGLNQISAGQMYVLAKFQSIWTPSYEFTVQSSKESTGLNGGNLAVTLEGKYNAETIVYGKLRRVLQQVDTIGKQSVTFEVQGWISRPNGIKLLEAVSQFMIGTGEDNQDLIRYVLDIVPNRQVYAETVEPIYVVVIGQRKPGQSDTYVATVKVSHGQERRDWIDADLVVENMYYVVYQIPVPERIVATVRYVPTSTQATLAISLMELLDESFTNSYVKTLFDDQTVAPQLQNLRVMRRYRNQILATLDDRKIGFEFLTSQMGHHNTYEHSLRLYSPKRNGRQIHYRTAYHFAPETLTYFYRTDLKSGFEQEGSIYQSTYFFGPVPEKPTSYMFFYDVQSPVILGDGHIWAKAFIFGPENKYQGIVATMQTVSQNQITFQATTKTEEEQSNQMVYYGQSNKKTYFNVTVYTSDGTIDAGVDGHVAGYGTHINWHNQNRHGHRQTGTYRFEFVGQKEFEAVVEHGHHGYEAKGKFVTDKPGVWIVDILVEEYGVVPSQRTSVIDGSYFYGSNGQRQGTQQKQTQGQYHVHVEAKDQCVRAEIEDQQQPENIQQLSYCMNVDQSNIMNLAVDSIVNGHKTSDLNVRMDTREIVNSVILSLKWNPSYQRTLMARFLNRFTSAYDQNELVEEMKHVVTGLHEKLVGHRQPGVQGSVGFNQFQALVDELIQISEDFGIDVQDVKRIVRQFIIDPIVYGFEDMVKVVYDYVSVVEQLTNFIKHVTHSVQNQCYSNDICRQVVHSIVSIDSFEKLIENMSGRLVESLKHTHRIISTSYTGRWIRSLIPSTVLDYIPEVIHQVNYYFVNFYTKTISRNYPLNELLNNIEHVLHEMMISTQWNQVEWKQVKMAVDRIVQLTLMPWKFTTTSRVLIYDPQQGQLQIELYGPAVKHPRYYQQKYNDISSRFEPVNQYYKTLTNTSKYTGLGRIFNPESTITGMEPSSVWSKLFQTSIY